MSARPSTYQLDSYRRRLETEVIESHSGDHPWVLLADTIIYPEGGGQPADRGRIDDHEVVGVRQTPAGVRHELRQALRPGPVVVTIDWERRFDHMQQHTAQHLLTALAVDRFGWATTSFHLGAERCDIEMDVADPPLQQIAELEDITNRAIYSGHPVHLRFVSPEDYKSMSVRSRGLPEGHVGDVRLVEIEGIDLNTCGGTHVSSTSELGCVKLLGRESIRGGTRFYYVAGNRVRQRLESHETRSAALRTILGAADDELVGAVERRLEDLRKSGQRIRLLTNQLSEACASELARRRDRVLSQRFEGHDLGFLQSLGRQITELRPDALVFLTSELDGKSGVFLLAAGKDCTVDLPVAGRRAAELLGGKGGGSERIFQGKAEDLTMFEGVVSALSQLASS